jgi:hypothetical protein
MATVTQMAQEFVKFDGRKIAHSSVELRYPLGDGNEYRLHGNVICRQYEKNGPLHFDWCDWYTPTTANHMNEILKAAGKDKRVSYAQARDAGVEVFTVN